MTDPDKWHKYWPNVRFYLFLLVPMGFYLFQILTRVENIPVLDEYQVQFGTANAYLESSFFMFLKQQFFTIEPYYNYYFNQLATVMEMLVFGEVNFIHLVLLGNLALLLTFYFLAKYVVVKIDALLVVFVGFLLLQFAFWEASFYGLCSIRRFGTLLFVILTIRAYLNNKPFWTIVHATIAVFATLSNGVALVPILFILAWAKKDKAFLKWWIPFSVLVMVVYAYAFIGPIIATGGAEGSSKGGVVHVLKFFFILISGSLLQNGHKFNVLLGIVLFVMVVLSVFLNIRKGGNAHWMLSGLLLFAMASQAMISLFRANGFLYTAYISRYSIYSVLEITCIALSMYSWLKFHRTLRLGFFALVSSMIAYNSYKNGLPKFNRWHQSNVEMLKKHISGDSEVIKELLVGEYTHDQFVRAVKHKAYVVPKKFTGDEKKQTHRIN